MLRELPPGRYEVTNFSKALVRDLELNIGTASTLNFDLKPSAAATAGRWT